MILFVSADGKVEFAGFLFLQNFNFLSIIILTMNKRLVKQILYGAGYLAVLFLIVFLVYLIWLKPAPTCFDNKQNQGETGIDCGGPCPPCEIKTLVPLESSWIKYFSSDSQTIIAAEIKNSNLNWGANSFSYTFDVYGENGIKIKSFTKNSFIYGGEIKYLIEPIEVDSKNIADVKISFSNINWKSAEEFPRPIIQLREVKTESAIQDSGGVTVGGFITNNNAFPLSRARIIGFLLNQNNVQISASKTELENIPAFEEKSFKINFPKNISLITAPAQTTPLYNFTRDLTIGSKGEDVKKLQEFLKNEGFFERETTNYFGSVTKNALIQYQKKINISPASGILNSKTRNYINSLKPTTPITPKINLTEIDPSKTKIYVEALR